ncbi:bifunctional folylpolyglutamate synthase/dihydrofolate synthase [bacterium]|nr:bifunctional folylpolyglutamate synthase/dihydrofolate synthase [candidate division CSSED10-310 bacterium]
MNTMRETLNYLYQFINYERSPDVKYSAETYNLDNFKEILNVLGNPQFSAKTIHVAGTKGKGSTAAMIMVMLESAGYKTGLYTSPHLVDIRERIRVSGKAISEDDFIRHISYLASVLENVHKNKFAGYRTTFEFLTAAAFLHFCHQETDWNIIEVGMGGRLDCTNAVKPVISVITPISKDHIESLGGQLQQIAAEKGGIIKPEVPVVIAPQRAVVTKTLRSIARRLPSKIIPSGKDINITIKEISSTGSVFDVSIANKRFSEVYLPVSGLFQMDNLVTALSVIHHMKTMGMISVEWDNMLDGLKRMNWQGRLSRLILNPWFKANQSPYLFADGAHNPAAAVRISESFLHMYPEQKATLVMGLPTNKDADGFIKALLPIASEFVATTYDNPRSSKPDRLIPIFRHYHVPYLTANSISEAISLVFKDDRRVSSVIVTGSLYLIGELYRFAGKADLVLDILR